MGNRVREAIFAPVTASVPHPGSLNGNSVGGTAENSGPQYTLRARPVYRQHLCSREEGTSNLHHWKFRAPRLSESAKRALKAGLRLRATIRSLERDSSDSEREKRGRGQRRLWRAGRRRHVPFSSGPLSGKQGGAEEERQREQNLARLKRVQEFRRRRHEALTEQPPRVPRRSKDDAEQSVRRSDGSQRVWLTRGRDRQAVGLGRRPWLHKHDKWLNNHRLRERHDYALECGERPPEAYVSELERQADLHAFGREEHEEARRAFHKQCEFEHWNERVRKK